MSSPYLNKLTATERKDLEERLNSSQRSVCFICEDPINLQVHQGTLDVDHIIPYKLGGKDDPDNFALTHSSCNRSKQDSNQRIARVLHKFGRLKERLSGENRGPNLQDVLELHSGAKHEIQFVREGEKLKYSLPEIGRNNISEVPIMKDELSKDEYIFMLLPIEYIFHDDIINPRSIGDNIAKLIKEFFNENPQLHISLGWADLNGGAKSTVKIFDGQHKAAAQILLGIGNIPVRIFLNPDKDKLTTTNLHAGTTLRQVAFDKSVQRHLGNTLYSQRVKRYQDDHSLEADNLNFSERGLLSHFKGETREVKKYILDSVRDSVTYSPDNKLRDYIDLGGRGHSKPISYSTIEKTFYSFFIYQNVLDTYINYRLDDGENPRELEKSQIVELMNIVAEEIFIGRFDLELGTFRIEHKIQKGETLHPDHVKAFRMGKEEVMYNWLKFIRQIIMTHYVSQGIPFDEGKPFHKSFPSPLWNNIRIFIRNLSNLPVWINNELSQTVFGGKQTSQFWQSIFETGKSPHDVQVLAEPINLMRMIQE